MRFPGYFDEWFRPIFASRSIETTTMRKTHPSLITIYRNSITNVIFRKYGTKMKIDKVRRIFLNQFLKILYPYYHQLHQNQLTMVYLDLILMMQQHPLILKTIIMLTIMMKVMKTMKIMSQMRKKKLSKFWNRLKIHKIRKIINRQLNLEICHSVIRM